MDNVINHIFQCETSHSRPQHCDGKFHSMDINEIFRANLLRLIAEQNLTEAEISKKAGLNPRAVTDIRERRTESPKISTAFKLAEALKVDPAELLGLSPRHRLNAELAAFLEQYDEEGQSRFLDALMALPRLPA